MVKPMNKFKTDNKKIINQTNGNILISENFIIHRVTQFVELSENILAFHQEMTDKRNGSMH